LICSHINSFEALHTIASVSIHGIGPTTVENILNWLPVNSEWVEKLPYKLEVDKNADIQEDTQIRKICITGKLDMTKQELADHLSRYGFEVIGSVTKDCYALISNGEESTKTKQANKYGIPVINYWKSKAIVLKGMF
jgi:NAD-dependent DNA ligase